MTRITWNGETESVLSSTRVASNGRHRKSEEEWEGLGLLNLKTYSRLWNGMAMQSVCSTAASVPLELDNLIAPFLQGFSAPLISLAEPFFPLYNIKFHLLKKKKKVSMIHICSEILQESSTLVTPFSLVNGKVTPSDTFSPILWAGLSHWKQA